jgi:acetyl-CoA C-acetyltransferase
MDALIFDARRTPRGKGKKGGQLYEVKPIDLLANVMRDIQQRHALDTSLVDDLIVATGEPVGEQGQNIAKTAVTYCDWHPHTTGMQIHRYCAGGLEAVNIGAAKVMAGLQSMVLAGGVESMSRLGMGAGGAAQGDPWTAMQTYFISQGLAADILATRDQHSREKLDGLALASQQRAAHARAQGIFTSIVPVKDLNGLTICSHDELIRDTSMASLAGLSPSFGVFAEHGGHADIARMKHPEIERIHHVHTAGNSSGVVDGAALVLVGNRTVGQQLNLIPRAKIRAMATVGTDPTLMLEGPVPATMKALAMAGLAVQDIDLFEVNEAFATVVLHFSETLDVPLEKINVNGGAIAMGHPIGATGAILIGQLLDELERRDQTLGVVTLCAGGGIGIATVIERI